MLNHADILDTINERRAVMAQLYAQEHAEEAAAKRKTGRRIYHQRMAAYYHAHARLLLEQLLYGGPTARA